MSRIFSALRLSSKNVCRGSGHGTPSSSFVAPIRGYIAAKVPTESSIPRKNKIPIETNVEDDYVIDSQTQGHSTDPRNLHKQDPACQSVMGGVHAHKTSDSHLDAASAERLKQMTAKNFGIGNKEKVGYHEQVGSNSATARHFEESE